MTRLFAILFCMFVGLGPLRAETAPACTGIDLLAKLKTERPMRLRRMERRRPRM